jgi:hypothetical protein
MSNTDPKEFNVSIHTNDVREAVSAAASALYSLAEEALSLQDEEQADEWDFEIFLRDLLGVLNRHVEEFGGTEPPLEDEPEVDTSDE